MAVRIRLKRLGRRNLVYYRIVAANAQSKREGRELEVLGTYDPCQKDPQKIAVVDRDRVKHWLSVGAQPTDTVRSILEKQGVL